MVHSCGSTVNKRPSYRMSAFEIRLIFEPSSGIPLAIFFFSSIFFNSRNFTLPPLKKYIYFLWRKFLTLIFHFLKHYFRDFWSSGGVLVRWKEKIIKKSKRKLEFSTIFQIENFPLFERTTTTKVKWKIFAQEVHSKFTRNSFQFHHEFIIFGVRLGFFVQLVNFMKSDDSRWRFFGGIVW